MRELYLVACGLIIGLSVRDWWNRERDRIAWDAAEHAAESVEHRAAFRKAHPEAVEPQPA